MGFSSNGAAALIIICKGSLGSDWGFVFGILIFLGVCALACALAIYRDDLAKIGGSSGSSGGPGGLAEPLLPGNGVRTVSSTVGTAGNGVGTVSNGKGARSNGA